MCVCVCTCVQRPFGPLPPQAPTSLPLCCILQECVCALFVYMARVGGYTDRQRLVVPKVSAVCPAERIGGYECVRACVCSPVLRPDPWCRWSVKVAAAAGRHTKGDRHWRGDDAGERVGVSLEQRSTAKLLSIPAALLCMCECASALQYHCSLGLLFVGAPMFVLLLWGCRRLPPPFCNLPRLAICRPHPGARHLAPKA